MFTYPLSSVVATCTNAFTLGAATLALTTTTGDGAVVADPGFS